MEQKVRRFSTFNNLINSLSFLFFKDSTLQTPTTLSIEERRVQESIDRLDRQLKGCIQSSFINSFKHS
jgi:hypothetical protein